MVFYAIFACTPLLVALAVKLYYQCPISENKRAKRAFLFFSGLILWLVIALRDKVVGSTDSSVYYDKWDQLGFLNIQGLKENLTRSKMEPGFLITVWLLAHVFPNPQCVFVFSGLFFVVSVCLFIYRNSENVVISLIIFITWGLYGFMVQGMRQSVAMCICLFSIESVKKRKPFRFFFLILLAFFYHKSALVFSVMYFIPWKRFSMVNKVQMLLLAGVIFACGSLFVLIGNELVAGLYNLAVEEGGYVALALYGILILGTFLFVQHSRKLSAEHYRVVLLFTEKQRREETLFIAMMIIGAVFFAMRYTTVMAIERISFYFQFSQMIVLPMIMKRFDERSRNIAYAFAVILSVLLFMYRVETTGLTPFKFFFLD